MNKETYLQELKAHDWTYSYASGAVYYKGEANEKRLDEIAKQDESLAALRNAYAAFIFSGSEEPALEAESAPAQEQSPPVVKSANLQAIMWSAWAIARKSAHKFGGVAIQYIGGAMRQAWALAKAKNLNTHTCTNTRDTVFYICIDEKTGRNTRLLNQPLIDEVYTDQGQAMAALQLLASAFAKPFIKTSPYYHL